MKKLLVVMPVHNDEKYIERAINSVINQTFKNFKLCIVNDFSTDNSLKKIEPYLKNNNIELINNQKNGGCFYSKNIGIKLLEEEHFDVYTTHDADDFSDSTRFEKIIKLFDDENVLAVQDFDLRIGGTPPEWFAKVGKTMPNHAHAFFSKKSFEIFGYYDNYMCSSDTELWNRILKYIEINKKYKISTLRELLYYSQITDKNMIVRMGIDIRKPHFDNYMNKISQMKENKDFYKPFFSIDEAIK
jgi:glycosyltransferase involved in cell wall biosynthesis